MSDDDLLAARLDELAAARSARNGATTESERAEWTRAIDELIAEVGACSRRDPTEPRSPSERSGSCADPDTKTANSMGLAHCDPANRAATTTTKENMMPEKGTETDCIHWMPLLEPEGLEVDLEDIDD